MKAHKLDIIKLILSGVLLIIFTVINLKFNLPLYLKIILFLIPYLICGIGVIKEAAENLIKGHIFDENFLLSVASIGAFIIGQYSEAVFVMIFYNLGELFEHISSEKSRSTIKSLLDLRPDKATVITENGETETDAKAVKKGDIIKVTAGSRIPLDGEIIEGFANVDNSAITGESLPVATQVGDKVFGGTVNLSGILKIRVCETFENSTASKILSLVENCSEKKAKSERFITSFAKYYTPAVCISALLIAVIPSIITGEVKPFIYRALTFLVISCPCALVVSVPLTFFCSVAAAAKRGVIIKGAAFIERLTGLTHILFDKTGTLTKGDFTVVAVHPEKVDKEEILLLAAVAEDGSSHPISLSLKAAYKKPIPKKAENFTEIAGRGVKAEIDGETVLVGNRELMSENNILYKDCEKHGTVIHIAKSGEYLGHIVISDTLKPDAQKTVCRLNADKTETVMLTGDSYENAQAVAKAVGISEFYAELKPEDKVKILESKLDKKRTVAFIGDGINDTPALARADIGIAVLGGGLDAAGEVADIILTDGNLNSLISAKKIAKRAKRIVKENIVFSLAVKFAVLIFSLLGFSFANMWAAAFADVGVLVLVTLNAARTLYS